MHNSDSEKDQKTTVEREVLPPECNNLVGPDKKRELPKRERRIPKRYVEDSEISLLPQKNSKTGGKTVDNCEYDQEPFAELRNLDGISLADLYEISVYSSSNKNCSNKPKTRFSCEFCQYITLSQNDILKHIESHSHCALECKECNTVFSRRKDLEKHHETTNHNGCNIVNNCNIEKTGYNKATSGLPLSISSSATASINIIVGTNGQIQSIDTNIQPSSSTSPATSNFNSSMLTKMGCSPNSNAQKSITFSVPNPAEELKDLLQFDRSGKYKSSSRHKPRVKTDKFKYVCLKCYKEYDCSSAVRRHFKQTHGNERNYKCHECSAAFKNKTNFDYHMAKHNDVKPFSCAECPKAFMSNYDLVSHMRIHTGEQPYTCDICGKHFRHRSNLIVHQRLHSGTKPYKCDICEANFNSTSHLKKHKEYHLSEAQKEADMKYKQEHTIKPKLVGVAEFFRAHYESLKEAENENVKEKEEVEGEEEQNQNLNDEGNKLLSPDITKPSKNLQNSNEKLKTINKSDLPQILNVEILPPLKGLPKEHHQQEMKEVQIQAFDFVEGNDEENDSNNKNNDLGFLEAPDAGSSILDFVSLPEDFNRIFKFQCHVCYKYFKQKSALTKHIRTHTGEKPYTCPLCAKAFSDPSNFKKHKMIHISVETTQRFDEASTTTPPKAFKSNETDNETMGGMPMPSPTNSNASDPDPDGAELIQRQNQRNFKANQNDANDDTDNDFDDDILDDFTTAKGPLIIWPDFKSNKLKPSVLSDIESNKQSLLKPENQTKPPFNKNNLEEIDLD